MSVEKYTWCRLELARDCAKRGEHSHISIQSPGGKPFTMRCKRETLSMTFIDLNPREIRRTKAASTDPKKAEEIAAGCMTLDHAHDIAEFVEDHPGPIVVNCEVGVSRSPAVVMALREWYGGSVWDVINHTAPNMHVAFTLAYVLRLREAWARNKR